MHSPETIGLLGGTFDPVHRGHLSIARSFLESGHIDELWILLTPHPPHKRGEEQAPYELRYEMLRVAFSDYERVRISSVEKELESPSYTWQTLSFLRKRYPDKRFCLCIGEDSYRQFTSWKNWRRIAENHTILVARRPNTDNNDLPEILRESCRFVEHRPVDISSTRIRELLEEGEEVSDWLPERVRTIIRMEGLYNVEDAAHEH